MHTTYDPVAVTEKALTTNAGVLRSSLDTAVVVVSWLNQRQLIPTEAQQAAWTALRPVVDQAAAEGWTDRRLAAEAVRVLTESGHLTERPAA